jgi:hypothetical protein
MNGKPDMTNKNTINGKIDFWVLIISFAMLISGYVSVHCKLSCLSYLVIFIVDIYLFALLLFAALRADSHHKTYTFNGRGSSIIEKAKCIFPSRTAGIFVIVFCSFAIVFSFAGIFLSLNNETNFNGKLGGEMEAIYFSLVTVSTVGYGDISPANTARFFVSLEIVSGFLLLFGIFPLLISRISNFGSEGVRGSSGDTILNYTSACSFYN